MFYQKGKENKTHKMSRMSNVREILCKERVTKKVKSENDQFSNRVARILLKELAP